MKLNPLIVSAAAAYGASGLALIFAPAEILAALGAAAPSVVRWLMQVLGGALLGLAYLNYLQRYAIVGGVLGRPVLLANLMFLSVSFFASLRFWQESPSWTVLAWTAVCGALLAGFGLRLLGRAGTGN